MSDLTQLKCKQCGAPLDKSSAVDGSIRCKYCGDVMSIAAPSRPSSPEPQPASQIVYQVVQPHEQHYAPRVQYGDKSRMLAVLLTFFGGYFGLQKFYLNQVGIGIMCVLFCWTFIPSLLAIIDFISLLCMSDTSFNDKYNRIM